MTTAFNAQRNSKSVNPNRSILILALLSFCFLLGVTLFAWQRTNSKVHAEAEKKFNEKSETIINQIKRRLQDHEKLLLGGVGLFNSIGEVSRTQWRQYISSLELDQNHPGIQGVGYSIWMMPEQKKILVKKIRAEGFSEFLIRPEGERSVYTSIVYLEPFNWRNQRAFGYDMYSEPIRQQAMNQAKDTGLSSISSKITLVQETEKDKQNGILMYVPVYTRGIIADSALTRQTAIKGFVYSPIRMNDFIYGTMGKITNDVAFEILDETSSLEDKQLFNSVIAEKLEIPINFKSNFKKIAKIDILNGRIWTFSFRSLPAFDDSTRSADAKIILFFGTILSILISFIVYNLLNVRKKALDFAHEKSNEVVVKDEFHRLILNSAAEAIYGIDLNGNCTFCNRACLDLLRYSSPNELIGKNMHAIIHHSYADGRPYSVEECKIFKAYKKEQPCHCDTEVLWRKDGTCFDVEYWSYPQIIDEEVIGAVVTFFDISSRKKTEEELKQISTRLSLATRAGGVGVWEYDVVQNHLYWDELMFTIYGITKDDFLNTYQSWHSMLHPDDLERCDLETLQAINGQKDFDTEFRIVWPDNSIHVVRAMAVVQRDEYGKALRMIGTNWDITKQKRIEQQLIKTNLHLEDAIAKAEKANMAKEEFLSNMSHEIRTPLNGVIGMAQVLFRTELNNTQKRYVETINRSGESLLRIINDILDYSKIEARKLDLEFINFDLRSLFEGLTPPHAFSSQEKGVEFICDIRHDVPSFLFGDPNRIRQILNNILHNAVKFTNKGEIVVCVRNISETKYETQLRFSVSDTGIGISNDQIEGLFQKFTQIDASATRKYGGTGLGLAISKQLVEMMGGTIGVTSQLGEGTEFWFSITLKKVEKVTTHFIIPEELRQKRILIVDDSATNREVLINQLKNWEVQTQEACDGNTGIQKAQSAMENSEPFHVIIVDMNLNGMDGLSFSKRLSEIKELKDTPLMFMTSSPSIGDAKKINTSGFFAYLPKPINSNELFRTLVLLLGKKSLNEIGHPLITKHLAREIYRQSPQMLIVEDNKTNQDVMLAFLGELGLSADLASNGEEALKCLSLTDYDLVFMDIQMPTMDGLEATKLIRNASSKVKNHNIPIIAMTANAMIGDKENYLSAGMNDYLSKPLDLGQVKEVLKKFINVAFPNLKSDSRIFNFSAVLRRVQGSEKIAKTIIEMFHKDIMNHVNELKSNIEAENFKGAALLAHSIKGASLNVSGEKVAIVARELEVAAKSCNLNLLKEGIIKLVEEVKLLREQIDQWLKI